MKWGAKLDWNWMFFSSLHLSFFDGYWQLLADKHSKRLLKKRRKTQDQKMFYFLRMLFRNMNSQQKESFCRTFIQWKKKTKHFFAGFATNRNHNKQYNIVIKMPEYEETLYYKSVSYHAATWLFLSIGGSGKSLGSLGLLVCTWVLSGW